MTHKHKISLLIGGLVSGSLLFVALRNVDYAALGKALAAARLVWVGGLVLGAIVTLVVRAWRWKLLLPSMVPVATYIRLSAIGLAVNNVLPLRLGEVVRAVFASEELDLPLLTVLASILIERLLDAFTIVGLFLVLSSPHAGMVWVQRMRHGLTPLFAALATAFVTAYFIEALLERSAWLDAQLKRHPAVHRLFEQLMLGFKPLKSPWVAAQILVTGLLLWVADINNYWMGAQAIDLGVPLPFTYAVVCLASAGFSTVVPTVPGYIGAFELVVSESVKPLGAAPEKAFGYAVVVHMVAYLFTTALGMYFLYRDGTSLMDVWRKAQEKR